MFFLNGKATAGIYTVALHDAPPILGVAIAIVIETFLPPIPSEAILPVAGFLAYEGRMSAWGAWSAATLGVLVGAWSAVRQYRLSDRIVSVLSLILISTPVIVLAVVLQILATSFNNATGIQFFEFIGETGRVGNYPGAALVDGLQHLLLPTISLSLYSIASYSRYQRNLMLDTLGADYVRTARAKGLRKGSAIRKHALRNAIIPMATFFAFDVATVFVGVSITETLFGWHGMGEYFIQSITNNDINAAAGTILFTAILVRIAGTLADLLYAALDPRVRV